MSLQLLFSYFTYSYRTKDQRPKRSLIKSRKYACSANNTDTRTTPEESRTFPHPSHSRWAPKEVRLLLRSWAPKQHVGVHITATPSDRSNYSLPTTTIKATTSPAPKAQSHSSAEHILLLTATLTTDRSEKFLP